MSPNHAALQRAIDLANGQVSLARALGTTQSSVWTWLNKNKHGTPAQWVLPIEALTKISRHDLRPDIYGPSPHAHVPAQITHQRVGA